MLDWNATAAGARRLASSARMTSCRRGGSKVVLGFGAFSRPGRRLQAARRSVHHQFPGRAARRDDRAGQERSVRRRIATYFAPDFLNGTEFGLFFINYHSRLPLISGRTGTQAGIGNAAGAVTAVGGAAQAHSRPDSAGSAAIATAAARGACSARRPRGGNMTLATATQYATIGVELRAHRRSAADVSAQASNIATHEYAQTAQLLHRVPGGHQAHRPELQHPAAEDRHRAAGRSDLSARIMPLSSTTWKCCSRRLTPLEQALFPLSAPPAVAFPTTCTAPISTRRALRPARCSSAVNQA